MSLKGELTRRSRSQAKPTHRTIIRLAPPLVITEAQIEESLSIIRSAVEELPGLSEEKKHEIIPEGERGVQIVVEN